MFTDNWSIGSFAIEGLLAVINQMVKYCNDRNLKKKILNITLKYHDKGTHLNTIERYYIYAEFSKNHRLNDKHFITPNKVFDVLLKPSQT